MAETREITDPAIYTAHLVRVVERWGVSAAQLLEGSSVTPELLAVHEGRIGVPDAARLAKRAIALTGEPGLGFYHGLEVKLSAHGMVGLAVLTSATLAEALDVVERFFPLRTETVAFSRRVEGDEVALVLEELRPLGELRVFVIESIFTSFVQVAMSLLRQPIVGRIEVTYDEPAHFQGFAHLWPGPVRFGRPSTRLVLDRAALEAPIVMADALAAERAVKECERELSMLAETSSLLSRIRKKMRSNPRGFPTLTELADTQHVSPRTLKRQLASHGTSFQTLLDELRRDRALSLLEGELGIDDIAALLGYADPSNFNRAFRRWMGEAPSEWRRRNGAHGTAPGGVR